MTFWQRLKGLFFTDNTKKEEPDEYEVVRARNEKGRYVADDPDTPENEAYTKRKKKKN